ncbi:MAG: agmatinase [Desulfobacterales bacterium]|jgi:agmatinase
MTDTLDIADWTEPEAIVVLGVPFDRHSSFLPGAAKAPGEIRKALSSPHTTLCTEDGMDLAAETRWGDGGDICLRDPEGAVKDIEVSVAGHLDRGRRIIALGGDHAITFPIVSAYARHFPAIGILHLDAHPDLYDVLDGDRHSHACPFARIMEAGMAGRLVQVGIRSRTPHQRNQAMRFGVETIEMRDFSPDIPLIFDGPVYLSIDLDCLDPAFAPGVSHHEPGGMSTRDVVRIIHGLEGRVVGADIVEFNPDRDIHGMTAAVAAKLLKELLARMLSDR